MAPWNLLTLGLIGGDALINFCFGHLKKAVREGAEGLIFLRRSAHSCPFMIRPVTLVACVVLCAITLKAAQTPAHVERVQLKLEVMEASASLPRVPDYGGPALEVPATLMPDDEASSILDYTKGPNDPLHALTYAGIKDGKATLYLIGCIEYRDVLEPNKRRVTRFARRYDAALSAKANKDTFVFPKVAGYNEAT